MARRRGFFAEIQHQARLADQRQRAAQRAYEADLRRAQAAQRSAERAQAAAERASEADRKRLEKEAAAAYVAARQAEAAALSEEVAHRVAELDELLSATLAVDDFVDLETLRTTAEHPPFPHVALRVPTREPAPIPEPPLPVKQDPTPVKGLFGRKQKAADAAAEVEKQYAADYYAWKDATETLPARRAAQAAAYEEAERARLAQLAEATTQYEEECAEREKQAAEQNAELDELINGLAYGTVEAVQEYVGIVLANSVYPDWFEVDHMATFEPSTAELNLRVRIPGPDIVPTAKHYRYVKASDEVSPVATSQKEMKERYAAIVHNIALRSLHEVFEADRRGIIRNISLEVGTGTTSPATGQPTYVPFVVATVSRDRFAELDLASVVPAATLDHLEAVVSKNPAGLVPVATTGVRRA
ncbi:MULTISPECIES: hypothetical protein [unclassified Microbacterium]|uniref:hypothetical protein n=1 Tax=unclassified Microbacterium TaxID=2609290 RepID=UPI000C622A72|nr:MULTISPECIES: hypothetical protein [unclassified Microbacterium]MBU21159.1 hypothetical protein [Microbacterium sp.]HBU42346.1 hypothetical protein [Microbacterium sp.]